MDMTKLDSMIVSNGWCATKRVYEILSRTRSHQETVAFLWTRTNPSSSSPSRLNGLALIVEDHPRPVPIYLLDSTGLVTDSNTSLPFFATPLEATALISGPASKYPLTYTPMSQTVFERFWENRSMRTLMMYSASSKGLFSALQWTGTSRSDK